MNDREAMYVELYTKAHSQPISINSLIREPYEVMAWGDPIEAWGDPVEMAVWVLKCNPKFAVVVNPISLELYVIHDHHRVVAHVPRGALLLWRPGRGEFTVMTKADMVFASPSVDWEVVEKSSWPDVPNRSDPEIRVVE